NGTSSRWAAGHLPPAHGIAAICSAGTAATASYPFKDHFTLAKAALRVHHQLRMSSLVSRLLLILSSMSSVSSSHADMPNQSMRPTTPFRYKFSVLATTPC